MMKRTSHRAPPMTRITRRLWRSLNESRENRSRGSCEFGPPKRHDRLDSDGKRSRQTLRSCEAVPQNVRLPTGQARTTETVLKQAELLLPTGPIRVNWPLLYAHVRRPFLFDIRFDRRPAKIKI